jgi:hypothetical protein
MTENNLLVTAGVKNNRGFIAILSNRSEAGISGRQIELTSGALLTARVSKGLFAADTSTIPKTKAESDFLGKFGKRQRRKFLKTILICNDLALTWLLGLYR